MIEEDWLYGLNTVKAALRRRDCLIKTIWAQQGRKDKRMQEVLDLALRKNVSVHKASRQELDIKVSGAKHQGVVALGERREERMTQAEDVSSLIAQHGSQLFLLVLDGVQDPHNLGACLRTAAAAGVHAVIAPKDRAVGITAVVSKVASGAAEAIPFLRVTNLARTLTELKQADVTIIGASGNGDSSLYDIEYKDAVAMVMGAEGQGIRRLTGEKCDVLVYIPMAEEVESVNVSVATGICLFEIVRQRR